MEFSFETYGDVLAASPAGRIDGSTCSGFNDVLHKRLNETPTRHLVIDLAAIEYISSSGLRELFLAGRRVTRDGGTFSICSPQPSVRELFEIAQFTAAYPMHESLEAAVAAASSVN
jgi:stage II sporulation protein AA (anti-sigma F factor antagonist)